MDTLTPEQRERCLRNRAAAVRKRELVQSASDAEKRQRTTEADVLDDQKVIMRHTRACAVKQHLAQVV